ncbi:MAG: cytochrome c3 family protein [Candidatus Aminicenantes bacterium]|nr:cytochrome c3 family protein [Candidatus Aminicenantes bacterium]
MDIFKKKIILFILGCFLFLSPNSGFAQIAGSAHDFSGTGWAGGEICLPCHAPHNTSATPDAPLWNHEETTATFTLYSSPWMEGSPQQPQGVSRLCLSCHDGTIALDSFGGNTGASYLAGTSNLTTDLSNDHPVSILWQHQNDLNNGTCGRCHRVHGNMEPVLPFFNGYVECATCHDVHNGTGYERLLRKSLQGSELCLICHGK